MNVLAIEPELWFPSPAADAVTTQVPVDELFQVSFPSPLMTQLIEPTVVTA